jgi:hypothetical protein
MTRRARLLTLGSLVAGIVALVVLLRPRDDAPAPRPPLPEPASTPARESSAPARIPELPPATHGPAPWVMQGSEPPASGPEKLQWLRVRLAHTQAGIALVQDQLTALRSVGNPSAEQRELLASVPERLRELEEKARQQADEIENFDVNAPAETRDPPARSGPPVKVSSALGLKQEQWRALAAQHFGPERTISQATFEELGRYLADAKDTLAKLTVPAGATINVQEAFLPVLDALMQRESTTDLAETQKLVQFRWEEFLKSVRALGSDSNRARQKSAELELIRAIRSRRN